MAVLAKCGCEECGGHIEFPAEAVGQRAGCPHCGKTTVLKISPAATLREQDWLSGADLPPAGFRPKPSLRYRFSLLLAAVTLPIFPLLYLGALLLPFWMLHLFPVHRHAAFPVMRMGIGLRHTWMPWFWPQLLLYAFAFFVEVALLLSVIKPLFALRAKRSGAIAIDPEMQPDFCSFVQRISKCAGSPPPKCIEVDCGLNAGVHSSRGKWSFPNQGLTLRIGLPLVAALNARELAGVIAHELGHFRQGSGLRLSFILQGMSRCLARATNERDALDAWLERESHYAQRRSAALLVDLASLALAFSRWSLRVLIFPSQAAGALLLRQMEHDADRYEIKLAGSAGFETTTRRLAILAEAAAKARMEMQAMWRVGRHLPDNFPLLVLQFESKMPIAARDIVEARTMRGRTRLLDEHPANAERLRRARAANEPGVSGLEMSATMLFSDFGSLARQATFAHYVQELGLDVESANLRKLEV